MCAGGCESVTNILKNVFDMYFRYFHIQLFAVYEFMCFACSKDNAGRVGFFGI